jgi:hypothetical protein
MSATTAWEQWGGKRPQGGALNGAQDAFNSLLRASPLSSTASTAGTDSENGSSPFSLKKMWDSAQNLAQQAQGASAPGDDADALESGEAGASDEPDAPLFPLWRRKAAPKNNPMLPTMGW